MWWWLACTPGTPGTDASPPSSDGLELDAPATVSPAPPPLSLAAVFEVSTSAPTTLELVIAGPEGTRRVRFPELARAHRAPVLGLRAGAAYTVSGWLEAEDGRSVQTAELPLDPGPAPGPMPVFEVHVDEPAAREPGYTLMPLGDGDVGWLVALDAETNVVWAMATSTEVNGVHPLADGGFVMVDGFGLREIDGFGQTRRRWIRGATGPTDVEVPFEDFHHDVIPLDDGTVIGLVYEHTAIPSYPASYQLDTFGPAEVRNDAVVHLGRDGEVLGHWAMLDLLDPHHIGFDSLDPAPSGALDWVHANAVLYDQDLGEITVSLRHQDAVVRFSVETGELRWIFGSPLGWAPEFEPYLLTPTEPFVWPTHQHGIELDADGTLRMFDNGNDDRNTPYQVSGQQGSYSRVFEARIDAGARTVTPTATWVRASTGLLFAGSLGNADRLPVTHNRFATFGTLPRLVEWSPDGEVVFDLVMSPVGWRVDRAMKVPSLYPAGVVEAWD